MQGGNQEKTGSNHNNYLRFAIDNRIIKIRVSSPPPSPEPITPCSMPPRRAWPPSANPIPVMRPFKPSSAVNSQKQANWIRISTGGALTRNIRGTQGTMRLALTLPGDKPKRFALGRAYCRGRMSSFLIAPIPPSRYSFHHRISPRACVANIRDGGVNEHPAERLCFVLAGDMEAHGLLGIISRRV